jgi:hypothetical protein
MTHQSLAEDGATPQPVLFFTLIIFIRQHNHGTARLLFSCVGTHKVKFAEALCAAALNPAAGEFASMLTLC